MHKNRRISLSKGVLLIALFFSFLAVSAQDECEDNDLSKKTLKLLEEGKTRKYLIREQISFLNEALELDENCLECKFELGKLYFEKADRGNDSFTKSYNTFLGLVSQCPDYHSDAWYYLGVISYGNKDYKTAAEQFEKYIHFPVDDTKKFSKDSDKKYDDVKEILPEIKFYADFYGNPVNFSPELVKNVSTRWDE